MNQPVMMLELEERLHADAEGTRQQVLAQLRKLKGSLEQQRRGLNSRDAFREIEATAKAVDAALAVMEST
jgi:type III secretion system YseE family protein